MKVAVGNGGVPSIKVWGGAPEAFAFAVALKQK